MGALVIEVDGLLTKEGTIPSATPCAPGIELFNALREANSHVVIMTAASASDLTTWFGFYNLPLTGSIVSTSGGSFEDGCMTVLKSLLVRPSLFVTANPSHVAFFLSKGVPALVFSYPTEFPDWRYVPVGSTWEALQ